MRCIESKSIFLCSETVLDFMGVGVGQARVQVSV